MPNGFPGSRQEWQRLENWLVAWDGLLTTFAQEKGIQLRKNAHGWPARSLEWLDLPLRRKIEIAAEETSADIFTVWVYAWKDVSGKRFSKILAARKRASASELEADLAGILNDAWNTAVALSEKDLTQVTPLSQ